MPIQSNQGDPQDEVVVPAAPSDSRPTPLPDHVDDSDGDEAVFDGYLPL